MAAPTTLLKPPRLQFDDSASCKRWIAALPLTNFQAAQLALTQQIALVRQAGVPPMELLRIMESLREPVEYVQFELAKKYAGKPLPLEHAERTAWERATLLWKEALDAYLVCRDAYLQGDPGLRDHAALVVMRCLRYIACAMFEHYRVFREPPAAMWEQLCRHYALAEQNGFAQSAAGDAFSDSGEKSSCTAAFCQALLAELANPYALSGRQMEFLARWTAKWSDQLKLSAQSLPASTIPPLAIDLATSDGPVFADQLEPRSSVRYLDPTALGSALRQTIALLKQGKTPAQLGLGDDARQPGCENLLMLLYIQWCRAGTGRGEQRIATEEKAQVSLGMHAAHFQISGRAFRAPGKSLTPQQERDMQLFGHISERTERMQASGESAATETWRLVNSSNSGFMCMLREPAQTRIGPNQLLVVRHTSGKVFNIGFVRWLRAEESNDLFIGVRLFAGTPRAVTLQAANFNTLTARRGFERGILLPAISAPPTPVTLIVPSGWYQAGRCIDIYDGQKRSAKLVDLLEKGADFERCTVAFA